MKLLTKVLANSIIEKCEKDPETKTRVERIIRDNVPLVILYRGDLISSIGWCLENLRNEDGNDGVHG